MAFDYYHGGIVKHVHDALQAHALGTSETGEETTVEPMSETPEDSQETFVDTTASTESVVTEDTETESPETESFETESKETESKETESKETESTETESKETESKETETDEGMALDAAREVTGVNIDVSGQIVTDGDKGYVLSGESFQYRLNYTVPSLGTGSGSAYQNAKIVFTLPDYVVMDTNEDGSYKVTGAEVTNVTYDGSEGSRTRRLIVDLTNPLPLNTTGYVTIGLRTENLKTPDKTLNFNSVKLQGVFINAVGDSENFELTVPEQRVDVNATSEWNVDKSIVSEGKVASEDYYDVTYQISVTDPSGTNHLGRLDFYDFSLTDAFPSTADIRNSGEAESVSGPLPDGGKAVLVYDVKMIRDGGDISLSEGGTDAYGYSVNVSGSDVTGINFNSLYRIQSGDSEASGQFVTVGQPTNTTYQYTVRYPYSPYMTDMNEEHVKEYTLTNTAKLAYQLLGPTAQTSKTDTASFKIGGYGTMPLNANLSLKKYIQVGEEEILLNSSAQAAFGNAQFTLYNDESCTDVAYNLYNDQMSDVAVGSNGTLVFNNLRTGTYYLKEVTGIEGCSALNPVKVVISDTDASVTVTGDEHVVVESQGSLNEDPAVNARTVSIKVVNPSASIGSLEFTKKGTDADGNIENLSGIEFTLTLKSDSGKTYTATSRSDGKTRFNGIPAGDYTLSETSIPQTLQDKGYKPAADKDITIAANTVNKPDLDGNNVFMNISDKGRLKIVKKSNQNKDTLLPGAAFELYGPYESQSAAEAAGNTPAGTPAGRITSGDNGEAVSAILTKGFYIIKEVTAPANYVLEEDVTVVEVKAGETTAPVEILNNEQVKVTFRKQGIDNLQALAYLQELAGATFQIYDANSQPLKGTKDGNGDYRLTASGGENVIITTELDPTGISVSDGVYLAPGTYYYKEIAAPKPFDTGNVSDQLHSFTVKARDEVDSDSAYTIQTQTVKNATQTGRIRIVKRLSGTETGINGVTFGIYYRAGTDYVEVDRVTTTDQRVGTSLQSGIGYTSALLDTSRTYYIKELSVPDGYVLDETYQEVSFTNGLLSVEKVIYNVPLPSIKIVKKDSVRSTAISGARFTLYDSNFAVVSGCENLSTDAKGEITFASKALKPDTQYYVRETSVPSNYVLDETPYTVTNAGVKYIPVKTNAYTDAASLMTTLELVNLRKADLQIEKLTTMDMAAGSTTTLANVKFNLYTKVTDSFAADKLAANSRPLSTKTTGNNGKATFSNLAPGEYWLEEELPDGYKTSTEATKVTSVTLAPGENKSNYTSKTNQITNTPTMGKLALEKYVAAANGTASTTGLANVSFEVENSVTHDKVTLTTDGNGKVTSGWLAPGTYTVTETSAPTGYIADSTPRIVTVTAGKTVTVDTANNPLTFVNKKTGRFTLNKFGVYTDGSNTIISREKLAGATFGIYPALATETAGPAAGSSPVSVTTITGLTSNPFKMSDSSINITGIAPGEYWLKETEAPSEDWELADPVRIKVLADGTVQIGVYAGGNWTFTAATSLDVNNESKYPRIRIIKIENGTEIKLNGAQFELYKADASGTVTTSDGTKVSLYKHNLQEIYESGTARDDATGNAIAGEAVTIKLTEAGNYYLKEIKAPDDHYFTEEWTGPIVVTSDMGGQELQQTVINYKNNQAPGVKVGPDGTAKLAGAVIAVFESSEDVTAMNNFMKSNYNPLSPWAAAAVNDAAFMSTHRIVQTATSDANGEFEFENLTDGHTYYMMELVPPENYQLSKTGVNGDYVYYTVVVSNPYNAAAPFTTITSNDADETARLANSHNLSIKNYEKQNILFTKLCNLSGQILKLDGATFEIYKANAAGTAPDLDAGFVDKITASTNGQYSSIMLPAGTYFIEETVTPSIGDTTFDEETGEREGVVTVTMPNSSVRRFYKVELGRNADDTTWDSDNPIWNNATKGKFVLNKISSESTTGKTIWVAATFKMRKWVVSNGEGSWKDAGTFTTDGKGTFTSDFIEPGYYELTEQSAEGYTVVTTPIYLEIGANKITDGSRSAYATIGSGSYSVYRPLEEVIADTPFEPITVENVPKSGLNITKYGVWSGNGVNNKESELLSGVEFELYVKLTEDFTADTAAGKQPAGFPKSASTVDGKASFTNLDQGSYWIKEVSVGSQNNDKYGKDSYTPIAVVLNSSTAVEKTVENEANYGKFRVTKVDADTLAKLDGATFEILKENGDSLSPAQFMTADGQGRYVSPLLPVGSYKLKETGTPNGYSTNKDTIF
ncbi:MAG: hypothetical protein EOM34_01040 [Clostridia bacterium]|nr:hypothetical protein [Clostridia bacterium]